MSCHDNDDVEPLVQLNKYRAKEIKGHNALWGDFKISLNYIDNSLDLGFITDRNQDTIGRLNSSQVLMLVPSISQEEIDQLEPGSTIPMKYQVIFQIQRKTNQEVIYHYAKEDLQYVLKYSESYLFEYDDTLRMDRKIMKWRRIGDSKTDDPLMRNTGVKAVPAPIRLSSHIAHLTFRQFHQLRIAGAGAIDKFNTSQIFRNTCIGRTATKQQRLIAHSLSVDLVHLHLLRSQ